MSLLKLQMLGRVLDLEEPVEENPGGLTISSDEFSDLDDRQEQVLMRQLLFSQQGAEADEYGARLKKGLQGKL